LKLKQLTESVHMWNAIGYVVRTLRFSLDQWSISTSRGQLDHPRGR